MFANPVLGGEHFDLFYAGPEGRSKDAVEQLIADAGLRPVWVGAADQVDTVDGVLKLWSTLARPKDAGSAFKLIAD